MISPSPLLPLLTFAGALLAALSGPAVASPPDTEAVAGMLDQGKYADAAAVYEKLYAQKGEAEMLFNAAFYYHRDGAEAKARPLAEGYLKKVKCHTPDTLSPREVRHCALASEMTGQLAKALALFEHYQRRASLWSHRSRAEDDIARARLKLRVKALESEKADMAKALEACKGKK